MSSIGISSSTGNVLSGQVGCPKTGPKCSFPGSKVLTDMIHEFKRTITVLSDIIIPADKKSGSASQSGVTAFIEFIVKDKPEFKTPMRGGLRWLDVESNKRFSKKFTELTPAQRINIVDDIAYPGKTPKHLSQGESFFTLMRNLTATGFFTSKIGIADLDYKGNTPNQWNGVPDEVLKQYGLSYDA